MGQWLCMEQDMFELQLMICSSIMCKHHKKMEKQRQFQFNFQLNTLSTYNNYKFLNIFGLKTVWYGVCASSIIFFLKNTVSAIC